MPRIVRSKAIPVLVTISAVLACVGSLAQDNSDADTREALAYTLTEAGLTRYTQATRKLSALAKDMPGRCDDDADPTSIAESVAMLNSLPGAEAAIRSAGMTTREYVVFSWSLVHNAMAAWTASATGGSLPSGTSQANVDFLNSHEGVLQQLGESQDSDGCDDEDQEFGEEEYEE